MEDVSIRFQSCIGVILILIVSWLFSESKQNVLISRVLKQLTIVFIFAILFFTIPQVKEVFLLEQGRSAFTSSNRVWNLFRVWLFGGC